MSSRWTRAHLAAGILLVVVLPTISWLDGSGQLAWTMFSRTGQYRVEAVATSHDGRRHPLATTAIAAVAGARAGPYLAGADRWRMHDVARITLRRHIDALAQVACRAAPPGSVSVDVRLDERASLDAPIETRSARARCAR